MDANATSNENWDNTRDPGSSDELRLTEVEPISKSLESLLEAQRSSLAKLHIEVNQSFVATVTNARHPFLSGRVQVCVQQDQCEELHLWTPKMQHLAVRNNDRVLLTRPQNFHEPIIIGVLDGFSRRPELEAQKVHSLEMLGDEVLRVTASDGTDLVEIQPTRDGPILKLGSLNTSIELPGALKIRATEIDLGAREGTARITASADVVVEGEHVRLN